MSEIKRVSAISTVEYYYNLTNNTVYTQAILIIKWWNILLVAKWQECFNGNVTKDGDSPADHVAGAEIFLVGLRKRHWPHVVPKHERLREVKQCYVVLNLRHEKVWVHPNFVCLHSKSSPVRNALQLDLLKMALCLKLSRRGKIKMITHRLCCSGNLWTILYNVQYNIVLYIK